MKALALAAFALPMVCSCRDTTRLIDAAPSVLVEPSTLDFGVISIYDHAVQTVKVTNEGRAPLTISELSVLGFKPPWINPADQASNPFTLDSVELPVVLQTDQTVEIPIHYDPTGQGPTTGEIHLATDQEDAPEATIPLQGVAVDAQAEVQEQNLDFGSIEVGTRLTQPIHLNNPYPLAVTVTPSDAGLEGIDQFSFGAVQIQADSSGDLAVTFEPSSVGKVATALSITPCNGCASQLVNLFGEGLNSDLVVTPGPIDFGTVAEGAPTQNVRITNVSTLPVELRGVDLDPASDPQFAVILPIAPEVLVPGAWLSTTIQYSVQHPGPAQGTFQVLSSSQRYPTLDVAIQGAGGQGAN